MWLLVIFIRDGPNVVVKILRVTMAVTISLPIRPRALAVKVAAKVVDNWGIELTPKNIDWLRLNPTIRAPNVPLTNLLRAEPTTITRVRKTDECEFRI